MSFGVKLHLSGDFACCTRPEMKVERRALRIDAADALNFVSDQAGTAEAFKCMSDRVAEKRRKYP